MGSLVNNVCFGSASDAVDAYFSAIPPAIVPGVDTVSVFFEKSSTWNMYRVVYNSSMQVTSATVVAASTPAFPVCDPNEPFFDGMALGWLVAGCMAAAFAARALRWGS